MLPTMQQGTQPQSRRITTMSVNEKVDRDVSAPVAVALEPFEC
jgi:hypothetical protein